MSQRSTHFTESHFDAKADRYQAAIRSVLTARYLELIPFFLLLDSCLAADPLKLRAADLLCGSGYLTESLRGCFGQIHGVDVSQGMLRNFPRSARTIAVKAAVDEQTEILRDRIKPNIIVSLAGLHHIYEMENGQVEDAPSGQLQEQLILDWATSLPPEGVMVIADVTDPTLSAPFSKDNSPCRVLTRPLRQKVETLWQSLWQSIDISDSAAPFLSSSLAEYVRAIGDVTHCPAQASPGQWFRKVVAAHGMFGHVDHFLNPQSLLGTLREHGFRAEYQEIPTPWLFPAREDFVYYFYEKFAFGPPAQSFSDISEPTQRLIETEANRHLGVCRLPGGGIAVGWRLGYYRILGASQRS